MRRLYTSIVLLAVYLIGMSALNVSVAQANTPEPVAQCKVLDPELHGRYRGTCVNGLAQGQGIAEGDSGAWYRGYFVEGRKSGYGVKLYANGDGYAGQWHNDVRQGQGRYEYGPKSPWRGDVYQGEWLNDKQHGRGTYIFFPSDDRFTATWDQGNTKDVGTTTITRRKRTFEALAPVLSKPGVVVCSVTTQGSGPDRIARGRVLSALGDRLHVHIDSNDVLSNSSDPSLNPRWEVLTDWMLCPQTLH